MQQLTRDFFEQSTLTVARALIGTILTYRGPAGIRQGTIIETEAYIGPNDRASHASRGRTQRTDVMFGPAGFTYIYLVYGMHWCLNFVTEQAGYPAAVLVRALEPLNPQEDHPRVAAGPGKVCRWLGLTGAANRLDVIESDILFIEPDPSPYLAPVIKAASRIGVPYAGEWADKLWRFYLVGNPAVSRK